MSFYMSIVRTLSDEIVAGKYACDFPTETQLVQRFATSRQTVVRAMVELVKAGLIERRRGSGTVVSRKMRLELGRVGFVSPNFRSQEYDEAVRGICCREGYGFIRGAVAPTPKTYETAKQEAAHIVSEFLAAGVTGVLLQPLQNLAAGDRINAEMLRTFRERNIPVVLFDHDIADRTEPCVCDIVSFANFRAGYVIGRHLVQCGARHVAFMMHENWAPSVTERMRGVSAAIVEADLHWKRSENVFACRPDDEKAVAADIRRFRPDAIVCGNDIEAIRLLKTLKRLKIAVPDRIMVTGFDDSPAAASQKPSLTTVRLDASVMAEVAAERLFYRIANPKAGFVEVTLLPKLVVRHSTRPK